METIYQTPSESCDASELQNFWIKVVDDQIASGMGAERFCQQYQINFSQFHYWKYSKIKPNSSRSNGASQLRSKQHDKDAVKFVSLQIANVPADVSSDKAEDTPSNDLHKEDAIDSQDQKIEIVFKNSHRVILPSVISGTNLVLLIKTVGELQC